MSKHNLLGKENLAEKMNKLKQEMDIKSLGINDQKKETSGVKKNELIETSHQRGKSKATPKLFVSGRLDRKKDKYTAKSLILLTELENEIKIYCRGGDLAILNYLINEGLKKVKTADAPINIDVTEIVKDIK